eukprot:jgi/Mesvir1/3836/Mv25852-RA.1
MPENIVLLHRSTRRCGQRIQCQAQNGRKGDLASQGSDVPRCYAIQPVHDLFVGLVPRGSMHRTDVNDVAKNTGLDGAYLGHTVFDQQTMQEFNKSRDMKSTVDKNKDGKNDATD